MARDAEDTGGRVVVFEGDRVGNLRAVAPAALAPFEAEEPMMLVRMRLVLFRCCRIVDERLSLSSSRLHIPEL